MVQAAGLAALLQPKGMLAIEKAGEKESTAPAQFALSCRDLNDRSECHGLASRWRNRDFQSRALNRLALGSDDERIPSRIGAEIGEDGPDPPSRSIDVDGSFNLSHGVRRFWFG